MDPELQLTVQRFRLDLQTDRDTINREIALRRERVKQMDGPIDQYVMNQEELDRKRKEEERKSAYYLTYVGKMDLPVDLADYAESFFFISPTTRGPLKISACSWKDQLILNVTEQACEKSIIPQLREILDQYATESRITDPEMKYYDYYPMEELTGR